jgi:hypothetical protein
MGPGPHPSGHPTHRLSLVAHLQLQMSSTLTLAAILTSATPSHAKPHAQGASATARQTEAHSSIAHTPRVPSASEVPESRNITPTRQEHARIRAPQAQQLADTRAQGLPPPLLPRVQHHHRYSRRRTPSIYHGDTVQSSPPLEQI